MYVQEFIKHKIQIETFTDDIKGLETIIQHKFLAYSTKTNPSKQQTVDGVKIKTTADYMNELSDELKDKLFQVFKYDFLLFGYDPNVFP